MINRMAKNAKGVECWTPALPATKAEDHNNTNIKDSKIEYIKFTVRPVAISGLKMHKIDGLLSSNI